MKFGNLNRCFASGDQAVRQKPVRVKVWSRWLVITRDVVVCFVALLINMALHPFFLPHVSYSRR